MSVRFEGKGMARCGTCGEPVALVLIGSVADVESNQNIIVRCPGCAATEEAEAITRDAANG